LINKNLFSKIILILNAGLMILEAWSKILEVGPMILKIESMTLELVNKKKNKLYFNLFLDLLLIFILRML